MEGLVEEILGFGGIIIGIFEFYKCEGQPADFFPFLMFSFFVYF